MNVLIEAVSRHLRTRGIAVTREAGKPGLRLRVPTSQGLLTMLVRVSAGHGRSPQPSDERLMLAESFISPNRAKVLRASGTPFVDSVGNMWLDLPGFVVDVEGRARPAVGRRPGQQADRLSRPASLRVIFALLIRPDLLQMTLRELARACGTSLGAAQAAMADLTAKGYVYGSAPERRLAKVGNLADRWLSDYGSRLAPKLQTVLLRGPEPQWWFGHEEELIAASAVLGGEAAYELHGDRLRALDTLVYGQPPWGELRKLGRLSDKGPASVMLRERFWSTSDDHGATAPSLLVYADLVDADEPRQLEAAMELRERDAELRRLWS